MARMGYLTLVCDMLQTLWVTWAMLRSSETMLSTLALPTPRCGLRRLTLNSTACFQLCSEQHLGHCGVSTARHNMLGRLQKPLHSGTGGVCNQ